MRLYWDDNITDRRVAAQLQRMGHVVLLPAAVEHSGGSDAKHLAYAIREDYVLLTQNYQDFLDLHDSSPPLAGIIEDFSSCIRSMMQHEI